ncbi:MAG: hypothetical protein ABSC71_21355, partial [Candidatus Acidiferrales bacterium]|jgi:hypothetical protein
MPDTIGPNADLRSTHRKIALLALSVAGAAIAALIFFVHTFGSKVMPFVPLLSLGVLAMLIVGVTLLWRSRAR